MMIKMTVYLPPQQNTLWSWSWRSERSPKSFRPAKEKDYTSLYDKRHNELDLSCVVKSAELRIESRENLSKKLVAEKWWEIEKANLCKPKEMDGVRKLMYCYVLTQVPWKQHFRDRFSILSQPVTSVAHDILLSTAAHRHVYSGSKAASSLIPVARIQETRLWKDLTVKFSFKQIKLLSYCPTNV